MSTPPHPPPLLELHLVVDHHLPPLRLLLLLIPELDAEERLLRGVLVALQRP